jgi:amino-acid N-acetyltransferase
MSSAAVLRFLEITADDARMIALLAGAGLPVSDLAGPAKRYWGMEDGSGGLLAAGGIERHGADGILRSCVVSPAARGRGHGRELVEFVSQRAREAGIGTLYLLTETADGWFEGLGFEATDRERVPPAVAASSQFAGICPASAAALKRAL